MGGGPNLEKVGPRRVGPERVRPRKESAGRAQKGGAPKGGGPKISRFSFPFPPPFRSFCPWGPKRVVVLPFFFIVLSFFENGKILKQ